MREHITDADGITLAVIIGYDNDGFPVLDTPDRTDEQWPTTGHDYMLRRAGTANRVSATATPDVDVDGNERPF